MMPAGRPSKYSQELADKICVTIATSNKSLRKIAEENDIDVARILEWLRDKKEFRAQYAISKELQADFLAEEIIDISEHTEEDHTAFTGINVIQRDKLRVDARKWVASKLRPKKYGDKVDLTTDGESLNKTNYDNLSATELNTLLKLQKKARGDN